MPTLPNVKTIGEFMKVNKQTQVEMLVEVLRVGRKTFMLIDPDLVIDAFFDDPETKKALLEWAFECKVETK